MTAIMKVPTGNYNVTELIGLNPLWKLDSSSCEVFSTTDGTDMVESLRNVTNTALLNLQPWEMGVCTFTNDNTAYLKIIKNVTDTAILDETPVDFEFEINQQ